ncbi:hypothetical protein PFICI_04876 [Pestalotiopsis fici W106-1]|uniref:Uncharacterized protein n=1 Tax=Pestalotiopsis fici (strain W106-1 / CGMCC3.15140) TaxID=1229662 RepID=W3XAB5_PESFW|nr:uncharacterized protein PFICI_04876 [Pestalotiopsis fici W106-1]ETS83000.1 hypothetical protein PFICI_04876 [Pestalotiopsis fici W106-1]
MVSRTAKRDQPPNADVNQSCNEATRDWEDMTEAELVEAIRRKRPTEAQHAARIRALGPEKAFEISQELYNKAVEHNDDLTEDETDPLHAQRALLMSRGDVAGKALAHPETLTQAERYDLMWWPEPSKLHAAIREISGLNTPVELLAKGRASRESLSLEELDLIAQQFQVDQWRSASSRIYWVQVPGNAQASVLAAIQEGVDDAVYFELQRYAWQDEEVKAKRAAKQLQSLQSRPLQRPPPKDWNQWLTGRSRDTLAHGYIRCWPPLDRNAPGPHRPPTPAHLLSMDIQQRECLEYAPIGGDLFSQWDELAPEQKAHYETRSEALRQAAWDKWDEKQRNDAQTEYQ